MLDEIEAPVLSLKIALLTRPPVKVRKRIGVYGLCLTMVIEKYYLMYVSRFKSSKVLHVQNESL